MLFLFAPLPFGRVVRLRFMRILHSVRIQFLLWLYCAFVHQIKLLAKDPLEQLDLLSLSNLFIREALHPPQQQGRMGSGLFQLAFEYVGSGLVIELALHIAIPETGPKFWPAKVPRALIQLLDRKSTRLNSSHVKISYAVLCLKKKIP